MLMWESESTAINDVCIVVNQLSTDCRMNLHSANKKPKIHIFFRGDRSKRFFKSHLASGITAAFR